MNSLNRPSRGTSTLGPRTTAGKLILSIGLALTVLALMAESCGDTTGGGVNPIPGPPGTPTPCAVSCPPPTGPVSGANPVSTNYFSMYYFNPPWTQDTQNSNSSTVSLVRNTNYGQVSAQFFASQVGAGTSASDLLSTWTQQHLDPNKFTAFQDTGPIQGAEIGFISGAGESYAAIADLPNAPNTPLFIQIMSAVKGTTGIIFAVVSPLDPSNPDPSDPVQVRAGSYDRLINTVVWK